MQLSSLTILLILSLLAQQAHSSNPITITEHKISQLNPSSITALATQTSFSNANFQQMATALGTLMSILQVITLPYIDNQLNSLNGSLQTVANLLNQLNITILAINSTLTSNINNFETLEQNQINALTTTVIEDNNALVIEDGYLNGNITQINATTFQQLGFINSTVNSLAGLVAANAATEQTDIATINAAINTWETNEDTNIINNATLLQSYISGNATTLLSDISALAINVDSEIAANRSQIEQEAISLSNADQGYIVANISAVNTANVAQDSLIQGYIFGNASTLQNNINSISALIDADVLSNVTALNTEISTQNTNLQGLISSTDSIDQGYITGNRTAVESELSGSVTLFEGYLAGFVSNVEVTLNALSLNDSKTVYNNNPNPGSASVLFNISIPVDIAYAASSYTDHSVLYDVTFADQFFNGPPVVTVSIVGPAVNNPVVLYPTIEGLTTVGCVVRVRPASGTVPTDGTFTIQLIAYGS